ncbi:alpha-galactosidase [bacterium]|nr:alpha-galactosidase [bacterium]
MPERLSKNNAADRPSRRKRSVRTFVRERAACVVLLAVLCGCKDEVPPGRAPESAAAPVLRACPTNLRLDAQTRTWTLTSDACESALSGATMRVSYEQGGRRRNATLADWPTLGAEVRGDTVIWRLSDHPRAPDLRVTIAHDPAGGSLRIDTLMTAREGGEAIRVRTVEPFRMEAGASLTLPNLEGRLHWLHNAFDSWSYTGVDSIGAHKGAQPKNEWGVMIPAANNGHFETDRLGTGWWVGAARVANGRAGFVAGALSARVFKTYLGVSVDGADAIHFDFVMGTPGDAVMIPPGGAAGFDPAYFRFSADLPAALDDYAEAFARVVTPRVWDGTPPRGWASWYDLFSDVTEDDVRDHIDILANDPWAQAGWRVLQIDDGYQMAFGDWETNEKFPSGMDGVAAAIEGAGQVPGLWIAPLLVADDAPLYDEHPEWMLHRADGRLMHYGDVLGRRFGVLDVTHPGAAAHVRSIIRRFVDDGYTYLKLDFLFPGAFEAVRYDPDVSAMQAFARACEIFRDEAGDDVFLLASGQPFLGVVGYFHAARTSVDIAYSFTDATDFRASANIARFNAARAWSARLFVPDPDNLLVRGPMDEAKAFTTLLSNVLAGGNVFLGDDLRDLSPARAAWMTDPDVLALVDLPGAMRPLDLFDEAAERIVYAPYYDWLVRSSRTPMLWRRGDVLAVLNFTDHDAVREIAAWELGANDGDRVVLSPYFDDGEETAFGDTATIATARHESRVYRVRIERAAGEPPRQDLSGG